MRRKGMDREKSWQTLCEEDNLFFRVESQVEKREGGK